MRNLSRSSVRWLKDWSLCAVLVLTGCLKEHQGELALNEDESPADDGATRSAEDDGTGDDESTPHDASPSQDDTTDDVTASDDDETVVGDDAANDDNPSGSDDDAPSGSDDDAVDPGDSREGDASTAANAPDDTLSPNDAGAPAEAPVSDPLQPGDAGWVDEEACVYHSPPVPFAPLPADAGADAGRPQGPELTIGESAFVGKYLADGAGYALYIYTADLPGDCDTAPVSTCFDDCLLAWPIFEAGDRELAEGLDDHALGTFVRADGIAQTTYYGWPLYYYKRDEEPGDTLGQGKGQVWYLAELELPNVVIMRASEERDGIKYLADGRGRTLYSHDGDVPATPSTPPRSLCMDDCRKSFTPFSVRSLRPVTDLEPGLFTVFLDATSGGLQVSFRGLPLYLAKDDATSGDMNGTAHGGFTLVAP